MSADDVLRQAGRLLSGGVHPARVRWHEERRRRRLDPPTLDETAFRRVPRSLALKSLRGVDWLARVQRVMADAHAKARDARYYETGPWSRRRRFSAIPARLKKLREATP